ncbi:MAG: SH3 domain-containing protein [Pseudomonadota bacterium]
MGAAILRNDSAHARRTRPGGDLLLVVMVATLSAWLLPHSASAQQGSRGAAAVVRPVEPPQFHSLKADRVNVRRGPGLQYPILFVFRRVGMPVEVIREFDNWWQIRDAQGDEGWVFKGLVTRRRTALLIAPKSGGTIAIHAEGQPGAPVIAYAEAGAIASLQDCDGTWCRIFIDPIEGHVRQARLWGVYADERIAP